MKNQFLKEIPRAAIISLSIFMIIILINFLNGNEIAFNDNLKSTFYYTVLYSFSLHLANTFLFVTLDRIFVNDRFSIKRIVIGFLSSFVLSVFIIFLLRIFINVGIEGENFAHFIAREKAANYIMSTVFTFIVLLIIHFVYLYKWYQENRIKEQKVIAGTVSAKYESLKNQIDPHFLFNSLNVLSSLIEESPENAQKFTTSLSKVYRYVLEQKDKDLVSVEEELSFAKTYMNLLKMRFEDSLTYEVAIENVNPDFKVVPLALQLLLENTIKHNVVSEQKQLNIKIYIENDYLIIENNLQKKEVLQTRKGVGLQNIIDRYALISKKKIIVSETEQSFVVKLPILTKQIVFMETQNISTENNAYYNAKQKVEELKGFYGSLISYCVVIPVLIFINLKYSSDFQWFWFPAFGWGFGLLMQALKIYGYGFNKNWKDRKIQEFMNKN